MDAWLFYLGGAIVIFGVVLGLKAPSTPTMMGGFGIALGGIIPWRLYFMKEENKKVSGDR